ncbi:DNA-binding transcriptional ArsR family regulator [Gracilibacillus halotolerans]|uniref:DNA-binding transcriptional ArsR family regulator n=1 Tax=Gracilibacillus halotolerans TaxID=74386 RepID=A0A841RL23_9BACI|nr:metalloregulator ArsR/SmtB family transcription factor [Gracilibacillus halotolerans]MBB6513451.1 DNA-binding transcriptional ArsR family regulator [Gracilibacillus halotolerans]
MSKKDTCDVFCYDEEKVNRIRNDIEQTNITAAAKLLKAIADENRAKITYALCQEQELCVCDIANIIGVSVANASHHLRTLHKEGLVSFRKEGKLAFYSLSNSHIKQIMMLALANRQEMSEYV